MGQIVNGKELSDFEQATVIWNSLKLLWREKLELLKGIKESTEDKLLIKQINDRLEFENTAFSAFKDNEQLDYIYVVQDEKWQPYGFFLNYDAAYKYTLLCIEEFKEFDLKEFNILKNRVYKDKIIDSEEEYDGVSDSSVVINLDGEIEFFYTRLEEEFEEKFEENRLERFEYKFFKIPCNLRNSSVKSSISGEYYVVNSTEEKWEEYISKADELEFEYMDIQVVVYNLTENGMWSHEHINPLYLEPELPVVINDEEKTVALREATNALINYFEDESEENARLVISTARRYAEVCCKEKIADIQDIKDIFC